MKAAVLYEPGPPSVFRIDDVPRPEVGADDILIRVVNCGVSYRDVVERNGTYRRDVTYPLIIGLEISGLIEECGAAVPPEYQLGDHVCSKAFSSCGRCRLCRNGRETTCSARKPVRGGYGEYAALPWDALVRVPDGVPFEVSCSLGPAAGVALNAVRDIAAVRLGEDVLVTGASGGVGWPSMQLARLSGARVIAHTRSESKRQELLDGGAHDVVVAADGDFSRQVLELTGGKGVDVVIDNVGTPVFDAAYNSLARHGRFALIGQLFTAEICINPARLFFKRAQLLGVGSVSRTQLEDVIALARSGQLTSRVATVLPLDDVAKAHELVEQAALVGRVVLAHSPAGV
ncbi:MAG: zinc-binding dehydrogenase [Actinomycetota bacterium]